MSIIIEMSNTFQDLFNENNIYSDSITTSNLIVTGTIDLTDAKIEGFPVDNVTIGIDDGVLEVKNFGINTAQLAVLAVHTANINNAAVTGEKLADNAVTEPKISINAVTELKIADDAITESKIADDAVTELKLADGAVTELKLADNAVTELKIADNAVTDEKIVSVSASKIDGTITNDIINSDINSSMITVQNLYTDDLSVANTIESENITTENITVTDTINAENINVDNLIVENVTLPTSVTIANLAVTGEVNFTGYLTAFPVDDETIHIDGGNALGVKDGGISFTKIANNAVTTDKLSNSAVTLVKLADSSVSENKIADSNVTTSKIANSNVTTAKIADSNITTSKIADSNVTTAKIADSNITTAKIADANVTTVKILDGNITTAKILDGNITSAKLDSNITISNDLKVGGQISGTDLVLSSTTDSTSTTTGSLQTAGGVGIVKNLNVGGKIKVTSSSSGESDPDLFLQTPTNNVTIGFSTVSNKVQLSGRGASNNPYKLVEWDAWNGGGGVTDFNNTNFYSQGNAVLNYNNTRLNIPITTDSTTTTSGALITAGGVGIAKNLYVGTAINGATTITSGTSMTAGTTISSSGSITSNLTAGSTAPSGSLVSLTTPGNYPGIIITRGSNKRWDIVNASAASTDDLYINSRNADASSSATKLRLGWGSNTTTHRGPFFPDADNSYQLGNSGNRWSSIAAAAAFFTDDASVITSSSGTTALVTVANTSNTANSTANLILRTGGSSAGDPYITHQVVSGAAFSTGVDNSDSDKFKISNSVALGTNDALSIDTSQVVSLNNNFGTVAGYPFYGLRGYVKFDGTIASNKTGTYVKVIGNTSVTVTIANHGLKADNKVYIQYNTSSGTLPTSEVCAITSVTTNTFVASGTTALAVTGTLTLPGRLRNAVGGINFVSYVNTGRYIVNFTNPFPSNNYVTNITSMNNAAGSRFDIYTGITDIIPGAVQIYTGFGSFSYFESTDVNVTITY